ncbi:MAG TPA: Yip1 family protein [Kangiella sp.]|uniref:Yip1 family protein n=1 Tax=Kangiella sp. TaxID=1920245 RepID=UPI002F948896
MKNRFNVLYNPAKAWEQLKEEKFTVKQVYLRMVIWMALLPPLFAFIGAVYSGWRIGYEDPVKLTWESALTISIAAYIAILVGLYIFARLVHWMAQTYDSNASIDDSFALIAYSCMPLFLISVFSAYPLLWMNTLLTLVAVALALRILFAGTPVMMNIDKDRGILFTNSILTVALVLVVATLVISVLFWANGMGPVFTR